MTHSVAYPSGRVESWDHTLGYRLVDADGNVLESRPLTPEEGARLTEFERREERETSRGQLHAQARAALASNAAYLGKVDDGTATQADHITQVTRVTRQVNALIRLVIGSDLLDESP